MGAGGGGGGGVWLFFFGRELLRARGGGGGPRAFWPTHFYLPRGMESGFCAGNEKKTGGDRAGGSLAKKKVRIDFAGAPFFMVAQLVGLGGRAKRKKKKKKKKDLLGGIAGWDGKKRVKKFVVWFTQTKTVQKNKKKGGTWGAG